LKVNVQNGFLPKPASKLAKVHGQQAWIPRISIQYPIFNIPYSIFAFKTPFFAPPPLFLHSPPASPRFSRFYNNFGLLFQAV